MGHAAFSNGPEGVLRGITRWEIRDRAQTVRRSIVTASNACRHQGSSDATADGDRAEVRASDDVVLQLQRSVSEYAYILGALGYDAISTEEQVAQAVHDGYGVEAPGATMLTAVRQWCAQARSAARAG